MESPVEERQKKVQSYSWRILHVSFSLPPVSFSVSLSCIHSSGVSLMAARYVIFVCFSPRWQFLQWSKMDRIRKWRQLSVAIPRDVFALLQRWRTANPWHPPFLSPLLLLLLPSHLDTATVCSDLFFFWVFLLLSDSIWHRRFLKCMCLPLDAFTFPSCVS